MANRKSPNPVRRNPAFGSWSSMLQRCTNPARSDYSRYGAVGISVCERWSTFACFIADVGEKPSSLHQLDRFPDAHGNYEPGNVRWATPAEQARNRKSTRLLTQGGETLCLKDWAKRAVVSASVFRYRINKGWPIERALVAPLWTR